eukprot:UN05375
MSHFFSSSYKHRLTDSIFININHLCNNSTSKIQTQTPLPFTSKNILCLPGQEPRP